MSRPYKALENKALHKGAYIGYVVAKEFQYTTNGHFMVAKVVKPDEVPPLKGQIDKRVDGSAMPDMSHVFDLLNGKVPVSNAQIDEWTNEAGLQLTRAQGTGYDEHGSGFLMTVSVQSVYIDYINALFDDIEWYMTPDSVFAVAQDNKVVGIIAKVKEDKEIKDEE